ncbi:Holliday junction branch migration protein RuvA [Candidatus Saccharibacteria bacterium CG_4_10_14_0_2_um_filter_52_9]|nr:MAG: Holliday junction branch migration protein RuvA [Candidatus Saccharibacteria bacterium CG_4_10_14_0_2_um_filter_52_9]
MIATLSGVVSEKLEDVVVLEVQGVGYGLNVTAEDYGRLASSEEAKVYVYEHIREQGYDLFGFLTRDTKSLFEQLLEVSGVGPKMALNMLSIGSGRDVRQAIASGDTKFIQRANGVGKRVAERVVVELKDKVGLVGVDLESTGMLQGDNTALKDEAVEALVALGYTVQDAASALHKVDPKLPTEERIKQALKVVTT